MLLVWIDSSSLLSVLLSRSKPRFEKVEGPSLVDPRSAKKQGRTAYDNSIAQEKAMRIGIIVSVVRGTYFVLMALAFPCFPFSSSFPWVISGIGLFLIASFPKSLIEIKDF